MQKLTRKNLYHTDRLVRKYLGSVVSGVGPQDEAGR
jgi:hypothetical protein